MAKILPYLSQALVIPVNQESPWSNIKLTLSARSWKMRWGLSDYSIDSILIESDTAGMGKEQHMRVEFEIDLASHDGEWRFAKEPLVTNIKNKGGYEPVKFPFCGIPENSLKLDPTGKKLSFYTTVETEHDFGSDGIRFACEERVKRWDSGAWEYQWVTRYSHDPRIVVGRRP